MNAFFDSLSPSSRARPAAAALLAALVLAACGGGGNAGFAGISTAAAADGDGALRIEGQPYPLAVKAGEPAMFAVSGVTGGGDAPLQYQWRRNGIDIPGATKNHLILPGTSLADNGAKYTVQVSRGAAAIVSEAGHLAVIGADEDYPWP